jgi:hypothetical protein
VEYFRGDRPWWEFREFLKELPTQGSVYTEALRDAPETVQRVLALEEELEEEGELLRWAPPAVEWTLRDELQAGVFDRLGVLIADQRARGGGGSPKYPPPFPRPVRAVDLARSEAEAVYLAELDDEVKAAQQRWLSQQTEGGDSAQR